MKSLKILSSLALMFIFAGISYSQENKGCCENTSSACCTEKAECCTEHASTEKTGNAGGDSTTAGTVCFVSGEAIGEGQGLKFDYYGTTYNFCCEGCLAKFKKDPMDHIKAGGVNCPVMGDAIESKEVFVMHNDTKYYLCCEHCVSKFKKDPEKYMNLKK
jgi:YHS domain-containing protein